MGIVKKPWELGEIKESNQFSPFSIPDVCRGKHLLVRLAPPKGKGVRDGLVSTFLMTSYFNEKDESVELVDVKENAGGYKISFPLGKRALVSTKYRGPSSYYRYLDKKTNQFYQIPQERFTLEGAVSYCEENIKDIPELRGFKDKPELERDELLDQYYHDLYYFGISQDLVLPIDENDEYKEPFVGLQTELYRVYTPPKEGERWGNIIVTKWRRGKPSLTGEFTEHPAAMAEAIHLEYQSKDTDEESFDPTSFVEGDKDDEII